MMFASAKIKLIRIGVVLGLVGIMVLLAAPKLARGQTGDDPAFSVAGRILDPQGQPVVAASIEVLDAGGDVLAEVESQEDGTFVADLEGELDDLTVVISRPHFLEAEFEFGQAEVDELMEGQALRLPDVTLSRHVTAGFWVAAATFVAVLLLIALELLHSTTASLAGVGVVFLSSFILVLIWPDLFIYDFERALTYLDFEVVFLVMGMMVVVGTVEGTGVFQWLTYAAFRLSRGNVSILVVILIVITSVASALLDNVTTMLLMTPITLQIALALGINPLSLLIPEVLASNVGGISTLVGTPTNILIGSFADIGFNDFLVNLTPGVVLALVALTIFVLIIYRSEYRAARSGVSPTLAQKLAEDAQISDKRTLVKSMIVFVGILVLFVLGGRLNLGAASAALMGATVMLVWVNPDVERMLRTVDWTTLVFFMALFMLVGAVREVGLMSIVAETVGNLIAGKLALGMIILIWVSAILSTVVANIPLAAAMLPVVGFLTRTVPGAESKALFYGLSVGAAMGGNGTIIGGETNIITAGIAERAGYPIKFTRFLKIGLPATLITVVVGTGWLFIRFVL